MSRDIFWLYPVWMRDILWQREHDTIIMLNFTFGLYLIFIDSHPGDF